MPDLQTIEASPAVSGDKEPIIQLSLGFEQWLANENVGIAFTTYQAGRVFFLGRKVGGGLQAHERRIEQCQGLWSDGHRLWTSGLYQLFRFENVLAPGELTRSGADRLFAPRETRITGRIDTHDIGMLDAGGGEKKPIFVNTRYGCLATLSERANFRPLWKPKFLSALVPEDRCHLNGLAMKGLEPAFVSAVSRSDVADGWRDKRRDGGVVIGVVTGEIVAAGLSMPHSPRLYDGRLWILNSGSGEFGIIDERNGTFTPVAFCPGYARGLAFAGRHAVIGLSRARAHGTFAGLALDEQLANRDAEARCGLLIINIDTGTSVEWLRISHTIEELYDVAILPEARQAEAIGFLGDEILRRTDPEIGP